MIKTKYLISVVAVLAATHLLACASKESEIITLEDYGESIEVTGESYELSNKEQLNSDRKINNEEPEVIHVYVCGAVRKADVYELANGSMIIDAIKKAGGFRDDAGVIYMNLAGKISDGQKIYVPTIEEVESAFDSGEYVGSTVSITSSGYDNDLLQDSGIGYISENEAYKEANNGKININTANKEALMSIPGVGESKASKIIEFRENNGGFKTTEDIMLISGIKKGLYDKIKDYICVD